jgi:hypothetical protein
MGLAIVRHLPGAQRFDYRSLVGGDQVVTPDDDDVPGLEVSTSKIPLRLPASIADSRQASGFRSSSARCPKRLGRS